MAFNPAISKIRTIGSIKLAGQHSLTVSELVALGLVVASVVPQIAAKMPFIKGHRQTAMYIALVFLFLVLWMD